MTGAVSAIPVSGASPCVSQGCGLDEAKNAGSRGGTKFRKELSEEEQREVAELKRRDAEVRAHEQAHKAAGGHLTRGGASYEYQTGPDGRRYAVGGEVSIDSSSVQGDPEATIRKMQRVRRAALAPAQPSGQDRSVAAKASQKEAQARRDLAQQRAENGPGQGNAGGVGEGRRSRGASPFTYSSKGAAASSAVPHSPVFDVTY
jgi:hypothetical protein